MSSRDGRTAEYSARTLDPNLEDPVSATIWKRIEQARSRWNVLEHPFYERWSAGELTREELAHYAGQYRHAVQALASLSGSVAEALPGRPELRAHAAEERAHVELWEGFVETVGGDLSAEPSPQTAECVSEWTAQDGMLVALARLYAIEKAQPEISRIKREGLVGLYGLPEGRGTAYFALHEARDRDHAAEGRALIEELAAEGDEEAIVVAAEAAYRANWRLLDGVEAAHSGGG